MQENEDGSWCLDMMAPGDGNTTYGMTTHVSKQGSLWTYREERLTITKPETETSPAEYHRVCAGSLGLAPICGGSVYAYTCTAEKVRGSHGLQP